MNVKIVLGLKIATAFTLTLLALQWLSVFSLSENAQLVLCAIALFATLGVLFFEDKNDNVTWFVALVVFSLIAAIAGELLLRTNEHFTVFLSEQLPIQQVERLTAFRTKWQWLGYAFIPLLLLLKVSIVALLLDLGCFFYNKRLPYKELFRIAIQAEYIFLSVSVCKILWFYIFHPQFTFEELQYFAPFSLLQLIGYKGLSPWFVYPLQLVSVFELLYWLFLAYELNKALKEEKGLPIVASGYGSGLALWAIGIMFLTLNNT